MRKTGSFGLLLLAISLTSLAQKPVNDANAEKRTVPAFTGIDVGTGITLYLTKGDAAQLAVSASEAKYRDKIVTTVKNGILHIRYENDVKAINKLKKSKELKAYVSYEILNKLNISTGGTVKLDGVLQVPDLALAVSTGAKMDGEVNIAGLKVNMSTGSKVNLSGKADNLDVSSNTGGKFFGENLATKYCSVNVSTGGEARLNVDKELKALANTGGKVKYKGDGVIREVKTNTGGKISKI